jgi:AcrR family transcriptional regulator
MQPAISKPPASRKPRPSNGKLRRRTQFERSASTRRQLFRATIDTLIERGYASLRTAEIIERAGLSKGALVHHFPTKNALIIAAATDAMESAVELEYARAAEAGEADDPLGVLISAQRKFFFGTFSVVQWELMVASGSDPALMKGLQEITARYRSERDRVWLDVLLRRGFPRDRAGLILEMTLSLWRGFATQYQRDRSRLRRLTQRGDEIAAAWRAMSEGCLSP